MPDTWTPSSPPWLYHAGCPQHAIVDGAKQGVYSIPPSRRFSVFILYCRCTRHITIFFLLLLFVGPAFALVPLLLLDMVALALATPR